MLLLLAVLTAAKLNRVLGSYCKLQSSSFTGGLLNPWKQSTCTTKENVFPAKSYQCQNTTIYFSCQIPVFLLFSYLETTLNKTYSTIRSRAWRATKYILNYYSSDYKSRLIKLHYICVYSTLMILCSLLKVFRILTQDFLSIAVSNLLLVPPI